MWQVLKQRNFFLLWSGGLISMIGNWVLLAAMPFYVYELTGSALATSGVLMAYIAPGVVFGSIAGVFVDRWDRRRTMVAISLLQAITVSFLALVQSASDIWLIYVIVFIESSLGQFFSPAENALLPKLVGEEHLLAANSLNSMNDNLARLGGPALGGVLLGKVGFASVVAVDAVSYLLAAILIITLRVSAAPRQDQTGGTAGSQLQRFWREWVSGLQLVRRDQLLAPLFLVVGVALFGDAILGAVLVPFVQDGMGLGAVEFGWMMTARGIGGLIGGLSAAYVGTKMGMAQIISLALAGSGLTILVAVLFPVLAVALPILVITGIIGLIGFVTIQTVLQLGTEDSYRGRVFGTYGTTVTLLMLLGNGIGGAMADQIGARLLMGGASIVYVLAGVLGALVLTAPLRQVKTIVEPSIAD